MMEKAVSGRPGPDESWEELAEHSLTSDDVVPPQAVTCSGSFKLPPLSLFFGPSPRQEGSDAE